MIVKNRFGQEVEIRKGDTITIRPCWSMWDITGWTKDYPPKYVWFMHSVVALVRWFVTPCKETHYTDTRVIMEDGREFMMAIERSTE